ncbi:hypothetical protein RND81_09G015700 [Saponaria officinalis]|uniref:GRF-type domain-containing protein n=1 Tax=Saponaria officinalis TaxID=3572 RepID=A0AAW1IHL3_SAPOF
MKKCHCGHPISVKKSSTMENPGRRFESCKLYNPRTKIRGCNYFRWYDTTQTDWQRTIINKLQLENKVLTAESELLKEELKSLKEEKTMLRMEVDKVKKLKCVKEEKTKFVSECKSKGYSLTMMICVIVSVLGPVLLN